MPRGISDDELALRSGEVTVSDINGVPLLALGLETIGEEGQIHVFIAFFPQWHQADLRRCFLNHREDVQ